MKRISSGKVAILQGSKLLFADFADGGPMWTGQGERELRQTISFKTPFLEAPVVMVGIGMWDIDHRHTSRGDLLAENVTRKGFDIVFRTWGDTRIARLRADWTAIGAMRDEDDWDVD
jgi:hypothetical protein